MKKYIGTFRKVIFSVMTLLLPGTVHAQFFDASLPGKKMTLQQCFDLAEQQNLSLQAGRKTIERAKVMEGTAWDVLCHNYADRSAVWAILYLRIFF